MIHSTTKVPEGTNRNLPARDRLVQLLAVYTNHSAQRYGQTGKQTDGRTVDMMMPIADHTV